MKISSAISAIACSLAIISVTATTELGNLDEWIEASRKHGSSAVAGKGRHRIAVESFGSKSISEACDPSKVVLADYPQWKEEEGYWIGEYSFYGPDGNPYASPSWPYKYDNYMGFITGNVQCNKYRQRNLFLYPSLEEGGEGSSKIFFADQSATTCDGNIIGPYQFGSYTLHTETTLVGRNNALLYQVYFPAFTPDGEDGLMQSQLTTLNTLPDGTVQRTRTAQEFVPAGPTLGDRQSCSFYRETKVSREEFYEALEATVENYNVPLANLGAFDGAGTATNSSGYEFIESHLDSSFTLKCEDVEKKETEPPIDEEEDKITDIEMGGNVDKAEASSGARSLKVSLIGIAAIQIVQHVFL